MEDTEYAPVFRISPRSRIHSRTVDDMRLKLSFSIGKMAGDPVNSIFDSTGQNVNRDVTFMCTDVRGKLQLGMSEGVLIRLLFHNRRWAFNRTIDKGDDLDE